MPGEGTIDVTLQLAVPDGLQDDVAAQFYVNPTTVVGLVDAADVPKVSRELPSVAGGLYVQCYASCMGRHMQRWSVVRPFGCLSCTALSAGP
jgi:hypothetical protein